MLLAPDKFRGSLSAAQAAAAMAEGARRAGVRRIQELPLADGGEGFLDVLSRARSGRRGTATVANALGEQIVAPYALLGDAAMAGQSLTAVVETAAAIGLAQVQDRTDPVAASSRGAGELLAAALDAGARRLLVGVGGSAMTDGGLGAVQALGWSLRGAEVLIACDVRTPFLDAARVYGPQKGASPEQVSVLTDRLTDVAGQYRRRTGMDVTRLSGGGAAGGLAGGLAAIGARLVPGFDLVAEAVGLAGSLLGVDVVVTGEGAVDVTSLAGKVVGEVLGRAATAQVPHRVVIAGRVAPAEADLLSRQGVRVCSLTDRAVPPTDPVVNAAALLSDICREQLTELSAR